MTRTTLGDLMVLQRGYDLPEADRRPGRVPVIGSAGVTGFHDTARVRGPGVTVGRSGASFGKVTYVREDYWPHNAALYVKDFRGNDPVFIRYLLESIDFSSLNSGSAQQSLNRNYVYGVPTKSVPLPTQRRIAGILSAYDELINNCQRRIRILDDMARGLYREWFVHFLFPGADAQARVDSPLGPIPRGWVVKRLDEIAENFDRLRRPLSRAARSEVQGPYPYYGAAKVFDYVNDFIFDGEYLLMAEDGSVITGDGRPVLQLVNEKFWPNNHTHILRGKAPISTHFLYVALSLIGVSPYISGSAQPKITQENMNRIPLVCASYQIHQQFDAAISPMIHQGQALQRKASNLRRTRDLLLPRLLSGQITLAVAESDQASPCAVGTPAFA